MGELAVGSTLREGRYTLRGILGKGSQGRTYEAIDHGRSDSTVALKRFDVSGASTWKEVELAEREAQVLARLSHPLLPAYVEHFEENGTLYLVMVVPPFAMDATEVTAADYKRCVEQGRCAWGGNAGNYLWPANAQYPMEVVLAPRASGVGRGGRGRLGLFDAARRHRGALGADGADQREYRDRYRRGLSRDGAIVSRAPHRRRALVEADGAAAVCPEALSSLLSGWGA
jgi:hypothetical protein